MPTIDRRPRARRRASAREAIACWDDARAAILAPESEWHELRRQVVAFFIQGAVRDSEQAARITDAYRKRPELMPMSAPK